MCDISNQIFFFNLLKTVKKIYVFDNDAISYTRPMCPVSKYNNWNIYNVYNNIHIIIIKLALQSCQGSLFLRDSREDYKSTEKRGWYNHIIIFLLNYLPNLKLSRKRSKVMLNGAENSGIRFIVVFCVCGGVNFRMCWSKICSEHDTKRWVCADHRHALLRFCFIEGYLHTARSAVGEHFRCQSIQDASAAENHL